MTSNRFSMIACGEWVAHDPWGNPGPSTVRPTCSARRCGWPRRGAATLVPAAGPRPRPLPASPRGLRRLGRRPLPRLVPSPQASRPARRVLAGRARAGEVRRNAGGCPTATTACRDRRSRSSGWTSSSRPAPGPEKSREDHPASRRPLGDAGPARNRPGGAAARRAGRGHGQQLLRLPLAARDVPEALRGRAARRRDRLLADGRRAAPPLLPESAATPHRAPQPRLRPLRPDGPDLRAEGLGLGPPAQARRLGALRRTLRPAARRQRLPPGSPGLPGPRTAAKPIGASTRRSTRTGRPTTSGGESPATAPSSSAASASSTPTSRRRAGPPAASSSSSTTRSATAGTSGTATSRSTPRTTPVTRP